MQQTVKKPTTKPNGKKVEGLQWHDALGQYAMNCGKYLGKNGKEQYRRFYLGDDPAAALKLSQQIKAEWLLLQARGENLSDHSRHTTGSSRQR
jgi:hypothetical protein